VTAEQIAALERQDEQFMLSLGIPSAFVDKVFSTPSSTMWFPTTDELKVANVISGVSSQFAITGLNEKALSEVIDQIFANSFYVALRDVDSAGYRSFRTTLTEAVRSGNSYVELTSLVARWVNTLLSKFAPHASDALSIELVRGYLSDLLELGKRDPEMCFAYIFPDKAQAHIDFTKLLTGSQLAKNAEMKAKVIKDGAERKLPIPTAQEMAATQAELVRRLRARDGDKVAVLAHLSSPSVGPRPRVQGADGHV
jgi:hypothetical protein